MLDSSKTLVFTIFLSFGLIAEPLLHDHHEIEEQTVIECLACEESELNSLTSKFLYSCLFIKFILVDYLFGISKSN